jgi:magnesium transporter
MPNDQSALDGLFTAVPRAAPTARVGDVRSTLADSPAADHAELAVCDGDRLIGLVPIERLLAANADTPVGTIVDTKPPTVAPDADQEAVAWQAARAGARSVAVVDRDGSLLGIVPPQRLISVLAHEHEEDLARLGGFLARTGAARSASEEAVGRRLWHRLPWLALGLAGAMLSAGIVASFEEELRTQVLLAFFVPAVVYMADAVGTQTETVVIRGIAIGIPLKRIARLETVTGLFIGAVLAAAFFAFTLGVWGDTRVAATVALALFASASIATVIAMTLPYLLARLGRDPAFGSGPLATVIQDLLSIIVYFAIAAALV